MQLLYPRGLWLLLCVALFLIACLIRPRYQQRTLSSLYLWRLSERFRKRQIPIQRLKRAVLLALQLAMLLLGIALAVKPRFPFSRFAAEYIAILDTSASMQLADAQGLSRFEAAQAALLEQIEALPAGSAVTIITTEPMQLIERSRSRSEIRYAVEHASCGWDGGDLQGALAMAQELLWSHPGAQVDLYTDQACQGADDVRVLQPETGEIWNVSVCGLTGQVSGRDLRFENTVTSFGRDAELTAALYVDGALKGAQTVHCPADSPCTVSWLVEDAGSYRQARVVVQAEDGLEQDNADACFADTGTPVRALLVGASAFYWEQVLKAFPAVQLETADDLSQAPALNGYDLYLFDGCAPDALPQDGSTWLINPPEVPAQTRISLGNALLGGALRPAYDASDAAASLIGRDLTLTQAHALRFREIADDGSLTPVLYCGEMPVMLAGNGAQNARLLVLALDLHDTNLPLLADFVLLVRNMLDYAMPPMLDALHHEVGDALEAAVLPFCQEVYLQSPDGEMVSLTQEDGHAAFTPEQPGIHTLLQKRPDGLSKYCDFFAAVPLAERSPSPSAAVSLLPLETDAVGGAASAGDDLFDPAVYLAAALLLILLTECVVYHREQF